MNTTDVENLVSLNDRLLQEATTRVQKAEGEVVERVSECRRMVESAQEALRTQQGLRESVETRLATVESDLKNAKGRFNGKVQAVHQKINQRNYLWHQASAHFDIYNRKLAEVRGYENIANNPNAAPASRANARAMIATLKALAADQLSRANQCNDAAHKTDAEIPKLEADVQEFKEKAERCQALLKDTTELLKEAKTKEEEARTKESEARSLGDSKVSEAQAIRDEARSKESEQRSCLEEAKKKYDAVRAILNSYGRDR